MKYLMINFLMLLCITACRQGENNNSTENNNVKIEETTEANEISEIVETFNFDKDFVNLYKLSDYIDYENIEFDKSTYSYPVIKRKKINDLAYYSLLSKLNDIEHYHYLVYKYNLTDNGISKKGQIVEMLVNQIITKTDIKDVTKHFEETKITNGLNYIVINPESKDFEDEIIIVIDKEQSYPAEINDPDGYTNIRKEPSTKSEIIGRFEQGYIFDVYECESNQWWLTVTKDGQKGYIHKSRVLIYDE